MVRSVNFRGYKTAASRTSRTKRELTATGIIKSMRLLGMDDDEIKDALLKMKNGKPDNQIDNKENP